jgi:hypothetical protein
MIEHRLESMILPVSLAAMGCDKSLSIEVEGGTAKFVVRLRDSVRFLVVRWNHEPKISIGIPIVAGVPMEQIQEVARTRLREKYALLNMDWPGQDKPAQVEPITGEN